MAHEFGSLGHLAVHFANHAAHLIEREQHALERVGEMIEKRARAKFGVYQASVSGFVAWVELAESTQEERSRLGFTPNDPLKRTGDLMDHSGHYVEGSSVVIGNTDEIALYQEVGTSRMPPRPVYGPAAVECLPQAARALMHFAMAGFFEGPDGEEQIHAALGYDHVV